MQKEKNPIKVVITGGPGVGKSTVLEILSNKGYLVVLEAARIVIEREMLKDSDCLPWKNFELFQNTASNLQFELENSIKGDIVFSDRGIVDGYAYSKVEDVEVPEVILKHGKERYDLVFFLDQLPNYQKDSSRREDLEKAKVIHEAIYSAYLELGYKPIIVPVLLVEERVNFILAKLKEFQAKRIN